MNQQKRYNDQYGQQGGDQCILAVLLGVGAYALVFALDVARRARGQ